MKMNRADFTRTKDSPGSRRIVPAIECIWQRQNNKNMLIIMQIMVFSFPDPRTEKTIMRSCFEKTEKNFPKEEKNHFFNQ